MTEEQQGDFSGISGTPGTSRKQILAAQFECYLKIITEPPRTDAGDGLCCQVLLWSQAALNTTHTHIARFRCTPKVF